MPSIALDQVVSAVAQSKRYRHVAPEVIQRLAREEIPKSKNAADAQKRTQRRLHQIFGAYHIQLPYDRLLTRLRETKNDPERFKETCAEILKGHASTAERLPEIESFYRRIFAITGTPGSILDLACGLNPVALPWMNLPATLRYLAGDIDREMIRFLNGFFQVAGIAGRAITNDLVAGPPTEKVDVALLLKTVACLQHQAQDVGRIIDQIRANWLVISFPTRSLGKISKGMPQTYRAMFDQIAAGRTWDMQELVFGSELVFVVRQHRPAGR